MENKSYSIEEIYKKFNETYPDLNAKYIEGNTFFQIPINEDLGFHLEYTEKHCFYIDFESEASVNANCVNFIGELPNDFFVVKKHCNNSWKRISHISNRDRGKTDNSSIEKIAQEIYSKKNKWNKLIDKVHEFISYYENNQTYGTYEPNEEIDVSENDSSEKKNPVRVETFEFPRDKEQSKIALKVHNFKCELDNGNTLNHKSFKVDDNHHYMEGHHLIPMKNQKDFEKDIDKWENIACLCPNCHKKFIMGLIKKEKK